MSQDPLEGIQSNAFDDDPVTELDLSLPLGPLPTEPLNLPPHASSEPSSPTGSGGLFEQYSSSPEPQSQGAQSFQII
jgi:hypothetical protein